MPSPDPPLDTTVRLITPENIAFHYVLAGPFRRFLAYGVDFLIRFVILIVVAIVLINSSGLPGLGAVMVAFFLLDWFYGGLCEALGNGQTPGKRLLGIRVVSTRGTPITGHQAVLRNLLRSVDTLPLVFIDGTLATGAFMVGMVSMALTRRFQRLGDLAADTMVVVEKSPRLAGVWRVEEPEVRVLLERLPASILADRELAAALSAYVQRRNRFGPARRAEIAASVACPLRARFGLAADTAADPLLCAVYQRIFVGE